MENEGKHVEKMRAIKENYINIDVSMGTSSSFITCLRRFCGPWLP